MVFNKPKSIEKSCYIYKDIWSDKNEIEPQNVSVGSSKKVLFNCLNCSHEYFQSPKSKSSGKGCPYCANKSRCGNCEHCLNNSCYRYKDIWSDKNNQSCENVAFNSHGKFWFDCLKCNHSYKQSISGNKRGCPYCNNTIRCGNCERCLNNSCYRYKDIWSDKNKEKCEAIALNSHEKFWFDCEFCGHDYNQSPDYKSYKGASCPYCTNKSRCGNCELCLQKSCFIYKDIWSDKNNEKCEEVAISSGKKYWFNCLICRHAYDQRPGDKSIKGTGCPHCVNKTELKVANFLHEKNIIFKRQYKIKDIKKYYDFYLPDFDLIIEIDGDQHFSQVSNWGCHEETMKNDIQKMQTGMEDSISFLRIYQPDIFNDKIDWKTIILKNLYKRTLPDITYISSNSNIYDKHNFFSKCIV
jgi:very-short-patch-repair endonuclease